MESKCTQKGCDRDAYAKGLCVAHYFRKRRGSSSREPVRGEAGAAMATLSSRVSIEAKTELERRAKSDGVSTYNLTSKILEDNARASIARAARAKRGGAR